MQHFDDLNEVHSALQKLMSREPALVKVLPRQPGTKEARYVHLLSGDVETAETASPVAARVRNADGERVERLESEIAGLRRDVDELMRQFADFRKQFD